MILCSGTYNILGSDGELLYAGAPELANNYVNYTQSAVDTVFKGFGSQFVSIAMVFFAFSTIMAGREGRHPHLPGADARGGRVRRGARGGRRLAAR